MATSSVIRRVEAFPLRERGVVSFAATSDAGPAAAGPTRDEEALGPHIRKFMSTALLLGRARAEGTIHGELSEIFTAIQECGTDARRRASMVEFIAGSKLALALNKVMESLASERLVVLCAQVGAALGRCSTGRKDFVANDPIKAICDALRRWPESVRLALHSLTWLEAVIPERSAELAVRLREDDAALHQVIQAFTMHADSEEVAAPGIGLLASLIGERGSGGLSPAASSGACGVLGRCVFTCRHNRDLAHRAFAGSIHACGPRMLERPEAFLASGAAYWWSRALVCAEPGTILAEEGGVRMARSHATMVLPRALEGSGAEFVSGAVGAGASITDCFLLCSKLCKVSSELATSMRPAITGCYGLVSGLRVEGFEGLRDALKPGERIEPGSAKARAVILALPDSVGLRHSLEQALRTYKREAASPPVSAASALPTVTATLAASTKWLVAELAQSAYNREGRMRIARDPKLVELLCDLIRALKHDVVVVRSCTESMWGLVFSDMGRGALKACASREAALSHAEVNHPDDARIASHIKAIRAAL